MRTLKYEKAFQELVGAAEPFGIDTVVKEPVRLLQKNMGVSYIAALACLRELAARNMIVLVREGVGGVITMARIIKQEAPGRFHEIEERQRFIRALWYHKRSSQENPKVRIVHSLSFEEVRGAADIIQVRFYGLLEEFEKNEWIQRVWTTSNRVLYIILTEKFPVP